MVARVRSYHEHLLMTFTTDGEEPEIQLVASGEHALKVALFMIAKRDVLRHGTTHRQTRRRRIRHNVPR
jgi:hypothetical protein